MPELITEIDQAQVRRRLEQVRDELGGEVRVLCATKYVPTELMPLLAEAGVALVGENRLQDLEAKQAACHELFEWHFIGALQSRKVAKIAERVTLIHSLCTDSALARLEGRSGVDVLIQVNIAGEEGKAGIDAHELGEFIERCPAPVAGLSTMPPFTDDPERSRPHFAALARLAAEHGLGELSMGTSQDWRVAAEEGATIIRLGSTILL